ncbi:hypothetical protein KEM54_005316 [Ascosphaera aggregata]|nr:hypothetical protein KEM54_005316 [Ascosphaera aggregata]
MATQHFQIPTSEFEAFDFGFDAPLDGSNSWPNDVNVPDLSQEPWQPNGLPSLATASPSPPRTSSSSQLASGFIGHIQESSIDHQPRYDIAQALDFGDQPQFDTTDVDGLELHLGTIASWSSSIPSSTPSYQIANTESAVSKYNQHFRTTPYQLMGHPPVSQQQQYIYPSAAPSPVSFRPRTPLNHHDKPLLSRTSNSTFAPPLPSPPSSSPQQYLENDLLTLHGNYYGDIPGASPMMSHYQGQSQSPSPVRAKANLYTHSNAPAPAPAPAQPHTLLIPKSRIRKSLSSAALPSRKISTPKQPIPTPNYNTSNDYYQLPRHTSGGHGHYTRSFISQGNHRGNTAYATTESRTMTKAKSMSNVRNNGGTNRSVSRGRPASKSQLRASNSRSNIGVSFVNFTPEDSQKLLSGVAPSGSSKTKARREQEAREKKKRLEEAAYLAIQKAGGNIGDLRSVLH